MFPHNTAALHSLIQTKIQKPKTNSNPNDERGGGGGGGGGERKNQICTSELSIKNQKKKIQKKF